MSAFTLHLTDDVETYLDAVLPFLMTSPIENGLLIRVGTRYRNDGNSKGDELWMWASDGTGVVVLACQHTPPHPVWVSDGPAEAAAALAHELLRGGRQVTGVGGNLGSADAFKDAWLSESPGSAKVSTHLRLLTCTSLIEPPLPPGAGRVAVSSDHELVAQWQTTFAEELGLIQPDIALIAGMIEQGVYWLWEVDGEATCLVGARPSDPNIAHIGPVYTPPQHRRRGYAAALTWLATKKYLDDGRIGTLYTDATNPTSNGVYESIGYVHVGNAIEYEFEA